MTNVATPLKTLPELETEIDTNMPGFLIVGHALLEIQQRGLYKPQYATFAEYCEKRHGIVRSRAYQLMTAAETEGTMSTNGRQLVTNERQIRPLRVLPKEERSAAFDEAVEAAAPNPPTYKDVKTVVDRRLPDWKPKSAYRRPQQQPVEWDGLEDWEREADRGPVPDTTTTELTDAIATLASSNLNSIAFMDSLPPSIRSSVRDQVENAIKWLTAAL